MARKSLQCLLWIVSAMALMLAASCGGASPAPIDGAGTDPAVSISISPISASVAPGATQTFTATVNNTSLTKVGWTVNGIAGGNATIGTISNAGVYTAPPFVPNPAAVTVAAVSQADSTKSATAMVTIAGSPPPGSGPHVTIFPLQKNVPLGTIVPFTATVTGTTDTAVQFLVNGDPANTQTIYGMIAPELGSPDTALYTAPLTLPGTTTVNVTAELASDPTIFASATVTLVAQTGTDPVSISPLQATVEAGTQQTFTATVTGLSNTAVTWQVDGITGGNSSLGTIVPGPNNTATYTAPSIPGNVTITAVSAAQPVDTASAQVTIIPHQQIQVIVSPPSANVVVSQTQQFTAQVNNAQNQTVTWQVNGVTGGNTTVGTISTEGLYTAPATVPSPAVVTVAAISNEDGHTTGTAAVTISAVTVIAVTISPLSASVQVNTGQNFTATVTNSSDPTVTWEVNGVVGGNSTVGTISSDDPEWTATYLAPAIIPNPATVTVTAVSNADPTKSASATVTITGSIQVTVDPSQATVVVGQTQQFGAIVTGTSDQIVYWSVSGQGCTGAACGTIDSTGLYQAPQTVPNPPTVTVTATADANRNVFGTATVTITQNAQPSIAIFPNPPNPIQAGDPSPLTFNAIITNAPTDTDVTWQLGCISLWDGDPGENCNDADFDGDGPGCITVTGGFQVCGTRPNRGAGNEPLLYDAPHKLFNNAFAPNSCEPTNNGSGDGLVPLTATMNVSGCPPSGCQATVCITVTP